jgi:hypothetical protein
MSSWWSGDLQILNKALTVSTLLLSCYLEKVRMTHFEITEEHILPETRKFAKRPELKQQRVF